MYVRNDPQALRDGLVICPVCQSVECHSNHYPNIALREVANLALDEHQAGRTRHALRLVLGWAFIAAANAIRDPYACDHCRENFG